MHRVRWIIFAAALTTAGCVVGNNSSAEHTGIEVSDAAFAQVDVGHSTMAEVKAALGNPTTATVAGDVEVWKYTATVKTTNGGYIFAIYEGSHSDVKTVNTFVEFRRDVVDRKWRT